jgi:hypothetical protein
MDEREPGLSTKCPRSPQRGRRWARARPIKRSKCRNGCQLRRRQCPAHCSAGPPGRRPGSGGGPFRSTSSNSRVLRQPSARDLASVSKMLTFGLRTAVQLAAEAQLGTQGQWLLPVAMRRKLDALSRSRSFLPRAGRRPWALSVQQAGMGTNSSPYGIRVLGESPVSGVSSGVR